MTPAWVGSDSSDNQAQARVANIRRVMFFIICIFASVSVGPDVQGLSLPYSAYSIKKPTRVLTVPSVTAPLAYSCAASGITAWLSTITTPLDFPL